MRTTTNVSPNISIVRSPLWNVRLNDCGRVQVHGVYISSDLEKGVNADGINVVSSRNVISDRSPQRLVPTAEIAEPCGQRTEGAGGRPFIAEPRDRG